jgi:hypothetical protein
MPLRDGKDNDSHEGQISIKMNEVIDIALKAAVTAAKSITAARRVSLAASVNTMHCTAFGLSPKGASKPTDEAVCVAALMAYFSAPTAEDGGFLMEISPERWLDAINTAEKILGRKPDAGLDPQFITRLRDYESNAANVLSQFLGSKEGGQPKSIN